MDRTLRVAFLSEHASPLALRGSQDAGGQNVYVDEVSRNLGRLGYAVDIFTRRDNPRVPDVIDWAPGVRIVNLRAGPPRFFLKDHLWSFMPEFRDSLLRFLAKDGACYGLIHGNFWMSGSIAIDLRRRFGIPAVQIFHAMGQTKQRHQAEADTSPKDRIRIERAVIREADRLIAQCPSERAELVDDYGADPNRVVIIPSGVNIETFRPMGRDEARRRIGLATDQPVVVYVGRMLPRKDIRNIVRAVALLKERSLTPLLLLVGGETVDPDPVTTPEIGELWRLAMDLGIADQVRFTGKRQADVLRNYYSAGDVVVTTPWYEPFGLTPLEAMACGRPVIGSAVGGITHTIADGLTGFLVPPRDPSALAERLSLLLTDSRRRNQMGAAARARVEQEFTWPRVAAGTANLYRALLAAGEAGTAAARVEAIERVGHGAG